MTDPTPDEAPIATAELPDAIPRVGPTPAAGDLPPGAGGAVLLQVTDVVKHFRGIRAVDGATFAVREGTVTSLIGPNGAGKSSLFNAVTGFYPPDRGAVTFAGRSIFRKPPYAVARAGIARTFQLTRALTAMPVIDNMLLAAPHQRGESLAGALFPFGTRAREKQLREQALELLALFRLDTKADDYAGTLSGGQRKLLEFARALMTEPRMVLLDEPMAGVNPTLGRELMAYMQRLRTERGMTFLFVEHDLEAVMANSDQVVVMAQGRVIADGTPDEVRRDQRVIDAYLGGAGG
ncbi:Branched-chain amino acid transport ATP-binding protein LivG (TC 3.A.1.4.1) [Patulibacter medicamentivorans]|uniref:Branched-chain amino acid transport ATP-binding protein LivG (TC 3.A.1.4.1) n=1 Tax=Patulibacter medicamentivorans TaxID=1097667 RepID=H0EBN4_9ACTN|nr:ABC transporter ATP-binding protein [Patulibacter medicamentivorans]EHN08896.1 Branched-chain amino acid transport ATP-binding protein LivG (TC 3.A.1.4.1) [Patulibacter medicamentivorans]